MGFGKQQDIKQSSRQLKLICKARHKNYHLSSIQLTQSWSYNKSSQMYCWTTFRGKHGWKVI
jgi:hypothetical protein